MLTITAISPSFCWGKEDTKKYIHFEAVANKNQGRCAVKRKKRNGTTTKFVLILTAKFESTTPAHREELLWKFISE